MLFKFLIVVSTFTTFEELNEEAEGLQSTFSAKRSFRPALIRADRSNAS